MESLITWDADPGWYVKVRENQLVLRRRVAAWDLKVNGVSAQLVDLPDGSWGPPPGEIGGVFHDVLQPEPDSAAVALRAQEADRQGPQSGDLDTLRRYAECVPWDDVINTAYVIDLALQIAVALTPKTTSSGGVTVRRTKACYSSLPTKPKQPCG